MTSLSAILLGTLGGFVFGLVVGYLVGQAKRPDPRPRRGYVRCACGAEFLQHVWHDCRRGKA